MKNVCIAFAAFLALIYWNQAKGMNLGDHCIAKTQLTDDHFFDQFPFEEYLSHRLTNPFQEFLQDRAVLIENGRGGVADYLLFEATEHYLNASPPDFTDMAALKTKLVTMEEFLRFHNGSDSALTFLANSIGDRFFGMVAYRIEEGYQAGKIDKNETTFSDVLAILIRNKYTPNIPASNTEKLLRNAQEGNWGYIWNRFKTRYLKETLFALSLALNVWFFLRAITRRIRTKRRPLTTQVFSPITPQNNR